ncbi:hypothetical protein INQ51_10940 [Maribellus sp. CM-23]|uniref:hypothetical protein n=1 Tax=Maribellus sp. CM-23 TaxID=2781026 RepID=UPI001F279765|nr:hypothetical protein [Maribellus sp. CM-23]MCE4564827.1 hypothetical protein [Maribellus sp. CM-23]
MNKTYTVIGYIAYALLQFILFQYNNSLTYQLILTCVALIVLALNLLYLFNNIRTGKIIKIGKMRFAYWVSLLWFLGGLMLFVVGFNNESDSYFSGEVTVTMLTGLLFIPAAFFHFENYLVLFKKTNIQFGRKFWWNTWSYRTVDKLSISDEGIELERNGDCEYIALTADDRIKMNTIIKRLKVILGDKMIIR